MFKECENTCLEQHYLVGHLFAIYIFLKVLNTVWQVEKIQGQLNIFIQPKVDYITHQNNL